MPCHSLTRTTATCCISLDLDNKQPYYKFSNESPFTKHYMKSVREVTEVDRHVASGAGTLSPVGPSQTLHWDGLHVESQLIDAPSHRIIQSFLDRLQHAVLFSPVPPPLLLYKGSCDGLPGAQQQELQTRIDPLIRHNITHSGVMV